MLRKIKATIFQKLETLEQVHLLPGECFLCQKLSLPPGIERCEVAQAAEFELESLSPFALENLAWGFYYVDQAAFVLLYAAPKDRLRAVKAEALETDSHLLPSFISVLGRHYEQHTLLFLLQGQSLSAVMYNGGDATASDVFTLSLKEKEPSEAGILKAREELMEQLDCSDLYIEPGVFIVEEPRIDKEGKVYFPHRHLIDYDRSEAAFTTVFDSERDLLWQADVRDEDCIRERRKQRRVTRYLWKGIKGVGIAAILLLTLQLAIVGGRFWLNTQKGTIAAQEPKIRNIESRRDLMFKLEKLSTSELKPFVMLDFLNQQRPKSIYFTTATAGNLKEISVRGKSTSGVAEVNAYAKKLRETGFFDSVKPKSETKDGLTRFTLDVIFNDSIDQSSMLASKRVLSPGKSSNLLKE